MIDGVGHLLHLQDPRTVALALGDFLARHPLTHAYDGERPRAASPAEVSRSSSGSSSIPPAASTRATSGRLSAK
jgi:hypothetical protein